MYDTRYTNKKYRLRKRSFIRKRNRLIKISVVTVFISSIIYFILFYTPVFKINRVQFSTDFIHSFTPEKTQEILTNFFNHPVDDLNKRISNKTLLLYREKKTQKKLKEMYPEIDYIEIDWKFFNIWTVSIYKKSQFAYSCNDDCFSVDENGIIFQKTNTKEGFLLEYKQKRLEIDKNIMNKKDFAYIAKIASYISNDLELEISKVLISEEEENLNIEITLNNGVVFLINNNRDIYPLTRSIYIAVNKFAAKEIKWESIKSIDFRFEDRIYFKEK